MKNIASGLLACVVFFSFASVASSQPKEKKVVSSSDIAQACFDYYTNNTRTETQLSSNLYFLSQYHKKVCKSSSSSGASSYGLDFSFVYKQLPFKLQGQTANESEQRKFFCDEFNKYYTEVSAQEVVISAPNADAFSSLNDCIRLAGEGILTGVSLGQPDSLVVDATSTREFKVTNIQVSKNMRCTAKIGGKSWVVEPSDTLDNVQFPSYKHLTIGCKRSPVASKGMVYGAAYVIVSIDGMSDAVQFNYNPTEELNPNFSHEIRSNFSSLSKKVKALEDENASLRSELNKNRQEYLGRKKPEMREDAKDKKFSYGRKKRTQKWDALCKDDEVLVGVRTSKRNADGSGIQVRSNNDESQDEGYVFRVDAVCSKKK